MNALFSILGGKCPRCRKGKMFVCSNPYNISKMADMHENCPHCGQPTQPEPGFYYGAMYVSYALGVALFAVLFVLVQFVLKVQGYHFMWIYTVVMLALWPLLFRLSRILYIYMFVRYDKKYKD
jgi:hypothetical protein